MVELVKGQARLANINLSIDCPEGLPAVAVDINEMKQVFLNLVNNAFVAMPAGGTLDIRCRQGSTHAGKTVVITEFIDSGVGIPEHQLDKIFDPFFSTKPEGEGIGLGLSISYMVVQNHCGSIEVESRVGEGSTFRVVLPAAE
jgi:two-component system sensor histidine kinase HydH